MERVESGVERGEWNSLQLTHSSTQLDNWLKEAEKYGASKDEVVFTVCANKIDEKNRLVTQEWVECDSTDISSLSLSLSLSFSPSRLTPQPPPHPPLPNCTPREGENWAQQHDFAYFETSAKTGENVSEMFESMFAKVLRKLKVTGRDLSVNKRGAR